MYSSSSVRSGGPTPSGRMPSGEDIPNSSVMKISQIEDAAAQTRRTTDLVLPGSADMLTSPFSAYSTLAARGAKYV